MQQLGLNTNTSHVYGSAASKVEAFVASPAAKHVSQLRTDCNDSIVNKLGHCMDLCLHCKSLQTTLKNDMQRW